MILNKRAANLLQVILSNRRITVKKLENKLNLTRRQVNYDLQKINDWLDGQGLPLIENIRYQGLVVNGEIRNKLYELLPKVNMVSYIPSQDDRVKIIFIKIFMKNDYLSVNHFTDSIKMSRNTVLTYIQLLKEDLDNNGVQLEYSRQQGYDLSGNEINIRYFAFKYISNLLQLPNGIHLLEQIYDEQEGEKAFQAAYKTTYDELSVIESDLGVSYVDEQLKELIIFFLLLRFRMENDKQNLFSNDIKRTVKDSEAYTASQKLMRNLSFCVTEDELTYISMHLLGLNTSNNNRIVGSNENNKLYGIIDQILMDFEQLACVTFTDREYAKNALFMHIRPAYYRMLFNIPNTNPYLEKIKQEYFDLFILVKKSLSKLEKLLNCPILEDEVGYITLHFGAFLKKQKLSYRRRRCIIICPNGVGTSFMLKKQMEQLIPEVEVAHVTSPREYKDASTEDIDFILSTVSIQTNKPLIIVSPILTGFDKLKIIQEVNVVLYKKQLHEPKVDELIRSIKQFTTIHNETALYQAVSDILTVSTVKDLGRIRPMLNQILTRDMIQLTDSVDDWREAIRLAAQPLVNNRAVEEKYIHAMIESVEKIGPYIVLAPKVAIPHARPEDGVKKIGMSLLKLNEPVSFSEKSKEKDVNLIFVIAAVDNEMHLKALSQLTELLVTSINCGSID